MEKENYWWHQKRKDDYVLQIENIDLHFIEGDFWFAIFINKSVVNISLLKNQFCKT